MNNGYQSRAKHIDVRYHFIRDHLKDGKIKIEYVESQKHLADFLLKPISTKQFQDLVHPVNTRNIASRGSVEENIRESC